MFSCNVALVRTANASVHSVSATCHLDLHCQLQIAHHHFLRSVQYWMYEAHCYGRMQCSPMHCTVPLLCTAQCTMCTACQQHILPPVANSSSPFLNVTEDQMCPQQPSEQPAMHRTFQANVQKTILKIYQG